MASYSETAITYDLLAACDTKNSFFVNLTKSYDKQIHDASTLSASFIMFSLTALFSILNLFSGLSDVSAILDPKVRVGLSSALTLFLPVMSYLFSEAKNNGGTDAADSKGELPQRARFILIWMLLVELLRKKVEVIRMWGYSGTIERAGRVLWLGSLVFSQLQAPGRRAMNGILWILCASKLVQRIAFTEFGKRSLSFGKNAKLIASYMAQVLEKDDHKQRDDEDLSLKRCKYAVMDEDKLVIEAIPGGYKLKEDTSDVATVGKIWDLVENNHLLASLDRDQRLRRLCLSFSLFKLLRRRFEHLPPLTAAETRNYRQIIFRNLLHGNKRHTSAEEELFDVTNDELNFLCDYHHAVVPVVLASPFFLLTNYFLLPLVVFAFCFMVIILCGNGNVHSAFSNIVRDNHHTYFGVIQILTKCRHKVFDSLIVFFCTVDFAITFLLFVMYIYEIVWEFFVFLLSDWFLVSLLSKYATNPRLHNTRALGWSVRGILLARNLMHRPPIIFNQFSVFKFCGITMPAHIPLTVPILVRAVAVPNQVKRSITDYLAKLCDRDGNMTTVPLSNGSSAVAGHPELVPYCKSDSSSIAEVILTWHIATSILEVDHPPPRGSNVAAVSLSKYCAYLVAFHPELLPENQDSVERGFKAMKVELYNLLGFWGYYVSSCRNTRYNKIKSYSKPEETVVVKGAALGKILEGKAASESELTAVWKLLADFWVELLVYIAASSDEESVGAHENVLAKGGEFVTQIWAMATHAGISRPADDVAPADGTEGITPGASSV